MSERLLAACKEAVRLYESYGLICGHADAGQWINATRGAIKAVEQQLPKPVVAGDVVQLRGNPNGPRMTVSTITPDGRLWCQWFVGELLHDAPFSMISLDVIRPVSADRALRLRDYADAQEG